MIVRSSGGQSTLSLLFSFLLATSCCEIEFLSPLPFSMHASESVELRLQLRAPADAVTEVQLWHAGEKIFTHGGSFVVKWPHNGAFTLLATANANQSNPVHSSSCNATVMFRKDDRSGQDDSVQQMKLIGLMMVRNEENRIGWAACALARHVDALVVRDDASDDGTVEELLQAQQRCGFELNLIHAPKPWNFHEIRTRADLLEAGRASGGTHFIFVDADEILTDNYRKNNRLRELMLSLDWGDFVYFFWAYLWKSIEFLRVDRLFNEQGAFQHHTPAAWRDHPSLSYGTAGEKIHITRVPFGSVGKYHVEQDPQFALVHLQFVHWADKLLKDSWYRTLERIMFPSKPAADIVKRYEGTVNEVGVRCRRIDKSLWFGPTLADEGFEAAVTMNSGIGSSSEERITLSKAIFIRDAFVKNGYEFFAGLNIVETMRDLGLEQYLPQPVPLAPPPQALQARSRLPILSIIYTTKHPGSYDMLLTSLSLQSSASYELICVDESAALRIEEIKTRARAMGVRLAAVLPGKPVEVSKRRKYKLFSAYNTGLLASSGAIITMLNDYSFLSRDFVRDTLAFYLKEEADGAAQSGSWTWTLRSKSLLGYADMFYSAPAHALNSSALVDHSALTVLLFDGLFGVNPAATGWQVVEAISPPESPKSGYRRHWGWDGAAMSAPWSLYQTLNGFDEELDDGDDSQMENIKDRAALLGYDVWIAPRSSLVLQLRHYDWNPPELWSRSAQEHNWERWRQKLTLIQKSEVPAVVSGSIVGFQLGAGTEHELMSHAVVDHIARWRERTRAHAPAASARTAAASCTIVSIDAEDDGRLKLNVSSTRPSNVPIPLAFVHCLPFPVHLVANISTPLPSTQHLAQVLVNGVAVSPAPSPVHQLYIPSPTSPGMYFVAVHECTHAQRACASSAACGATFVVE